MHINWLNVQTRSTRIIGQQFSPTNTAGKVFNQNTLLVKTDSTKTVSLSAALFWPRRTGVGQLVSFPFLYFLSFSYLALLFLFVPCLSFPFFFLQFHLKGTKQAVQCTWGMRHRRVSAAGLSACLACRKRFAPVLAVANKSKPTCKRGGEKKEGKSFIDTITTSMRASAYSRPAPQRRLQIFKPHSAKCSGHPSRLEKTAISDETSAFFFWRLVISCLHVCLRTWKTQGKKYTWEAHKNAISNNRKVQLKRFEQVV